MKKIFIFFLFLTIFSFSQERWEKKKLDVQYVPDEIIVKFKNSQVVNLICEKYNLEIKKIPGIIENLYVLKIKDGVSVERKISEMKKEGDILYIEPNYIFKLFSTTPNDPFFNLQWGLTKIKAEQAWDITKGDTSIVVAILDTGIDYTPGPISGGVDRKHPDLANNMWINKNELIFNQIIYNYIDDDRNGYVDDFYGINPTISNTQSYQRGAPSEFVEPESGIYRGHGTHVAGIIGAVGNNGIGVCGVNWYVGLMPLKIGASSGNITIDWIAECIEYVLKKKDQGENIVAVNASFGGYVRTQLLEEAIKKLMEKGILFIAAAGNDLINIDYHPFSPAGIYLPNIITVLATDINDNPAIFSTLGSGTNYGKYRVHIGAPGKDIYSTFPTNEYKSLSGTSMAAPFVSGLSALIKSKFRDYNWIKIKNLILSSGDDIDSLKDISITGKRINAYDAVSSKRKTVLARLRPIGDKVSCYYKDTLDISALHIRDSDPNGQVTINLDSGEILTLYDDGNGFDIVSNDGIYSGCYTYEDTGKKRFTFPNGDSFECFFLKGYNYYETGFIWEDITNLGINLNLIDNQVVKIDSPFPIKFGGYEPGFTDIYIDSNGIISFFDDIKNYYWTNNSLFGIPDSSLNVQISPFRDDLKPLGTNNVYYAVIGDAPNRKLVIEWRDVLHYNVGGTNGVTFQVVFFENKSDILFNYKDVEFGNIIYDNGANACVGIQVSSKSGKLFSYRWPFLRNNMSLYWVIEDLPKQLQKPTGLKAIGGEKRIELRWDSLTSSNHTGFEIRRKHPTILNPYDNYKLIAYVSADATTYVDTSVYSDSRPYYYVIRAINQFTGEISEDSDPVWAIPTAFPVDENPTELQAYGGWNSLVIQWSDNTQSESYYYIEFWKNRRPDDVTMPDTVLQVIADRVYNPTSGLCEIIIYDTHILWTKARWYIRINARHRNFFYGFSWYAKPSPNFSNKETIPNIYTPDQKTKYYYIWVDTAGIPTQQTGGGCFIASVCFGENSWQVKLFKNFRDNFLAKNIYGRKFINFYYNHSPSFAEFLRHNNFLIVPVKIFLYIILFLLYLVMTGILPYLILFGSLILLIKKVK
ncbi:MAG: S8 family serine peptidase [Candidatus Omnitrophica bacterium]|nr:S8 family serine peptidase [Candidatus Omnitrophota bacterium]